MSFSKTISVVAALGSIFSVGLASWKISEDIKNAQTAPLEQKINQLEEKLKEKEETPQTQQPIIIQQPPQVLPPLPPLPPSPEPKPGEIE
jgi:hypothetical protein